MRNRSRKARSFWWSKGRVVEVADVVSCMRTRDWVRSWVIGSFRMRKHPSKVWLRRPPRRSAICKLRLHCPRRQRRFSGSFCSQREQFEAGQSSIRARLLEKEIIQTRCSRLNKISASARTKNGVRNWPRLVVEMRKHFPSTGRGARAASARAKNRARGWAEATHSECREAPPARRKGSTLLSDRRAPRLKKRFNYFGDSRI